MDQLKLVWELEKYNNIIDKCNISLNELEKSLRSNSLINRINELEANVKLIKVKIAENSKEVIKFERLLKEYDYTKKKLEEDLFSGEIRDIKQLEQLSLDKERTFSLIDDLESKILKLIDDNEDLEQRFIGLNDDYQEIKIEKNVLQEEVNVMIKELKKRIHDAELGKDEIAANIETNILKRYDLTRAKKGRGIVSVANDICGGCNVRIPTYLIQDIKKGSEIIYCESCSRLLYYIDN